MAERFVLNGVAQFGLLIWRSFRGRVLSNMWVSVEIFINE